MNLKQQLSYRNPFARRLRNTTIAQAVASHDFVYIVCAAVTKYKNGEFIGQRRIETVKRVYLLWVIGFHQCILTEYQSVPKTSSCPASVPVFDHNWKQSNGQCYLSMYWVPQSQMNQKFQLEAVSCSGRAEYMGRTVGRLFNRTGESLDNISFMASS